MDGLAYTIGWLSGALAGFFCGCVFTHIITLVYWHKMVIGQVEDFKNKLGFSKGGEKDDVMWKGIGTAMQMMNKPRGKTDPPTE